jgi:hypothetical protein
VKPHKVRYYLERRDPEFAAKMAGVLCVYCEVRLLKKQTKSADAVAIVSYDEKRAGDRRDRTGLAACARHSPDCLPRS